VVCVAKRVSKIRVEMAALTVRRKDLHLQDRGLLGEDTIFFFAAKEDNLFLTNNAELLKEVDRRVRR
jgi:hypothetical protein